jgi:shikimate kinase
VRGVGETTAAITIVNALPTGVGAAVGIELRVRAVLELHPAGSRGKWDVRVADAARTPLVIAALSESLNRFAPGSSGTGELTLRSEIPSSRGLKSSSAVGSAIVLAVAEATDVSLEPIEVARMSARISQLVGVSATGALDDALAGLSSGMVVTDNLRGELLRSYPPTPNLGVALYVPPTPHRPSPEWASAFAAERAPGQAAVDAALAGDWATAMRLNTQLVERVIGYDYGSIRSELLRGGAVASGVSGMGPALAAIAPRARLSDLLASYPRSAGERRIVSFSQPGPGPGQATP